MTSAHPVTFKFLIERVSSHLWVLFQLLAILFAETTSLLLPEKLLAAKLPLLRVFSTVVTSLLADVLVAFTTLVPLLVAVIVIVVVSLLPQRLNVDLLLTLGALLDSFRLLPSVHLLTVVVVVVVIVAFASIATARFPLTKKQNDVRLDCE